MYWTCILRASFAMWSAAGDTDVNVTVPVLTQLAISWKCQSTSCVYLLLCGSNGIISEETHYLLKSNDCPTNLSLFPLWYPATGVIFLTTTLNPLPIKTFYVSSLMPEMHSLGSHSKPKISSPASYSFLIHSCSSRTGNSFLGTQRSPFSSNAVPTVPFP